MIQYFLKFVLTIATMVLLTLAKAGNDPITIEDAWIREVPPGVPTLAAYMTISNNTQASISLTGVSSNISQKGELHQVNMDGDVMQMRKVPEVVIEAGQYIEFKPGGFHVMLIGVTAAQQAGDKVEIVFELKDHSPVKMIVPVKKSS